MTQRKIPAAFYRGGTSKGVFFHTGDLPPPGAERDRILLAITGSPDAYGKQIDGMGGATSSTSKVVLISKSERPDCDVDYLFGHVDIERPVIDWTGNCGNLISAVGPYAIEEGLVPAVEGKTTVRIWQANLGERIVAQVPVKNGEPEVSGAYKLDGVTMPGAEIVIEYLDAGGGANPLPTGNVVDTLDVPGVGRIEATLVNAGNATIFVRAADLGLKGTELQSEVNNNTALLAKFEAIRAAGAVAMGLAKTAEEATARRPATPKISFVAPPAAYTASSGAQLAASEIDCLARIVSMGKLHHAFTGTGSVSVAVAAALPGSIVNQAVGRVDDRVPALTRMGHPSGAMAVGAVLSKNAQGWKVEKAVMSRSARRLMSGWVHVPMALA
jgi:probable AcnD-accessory protein PrpF